MSLRILFTLLALFSSCCIAGFWEEFRKVRQRRVQERRIAETYNYFRKEQPKAEKLFSNNPKTKEMAWKLYDRLSKVPVYFGADVNVGKKYLKQLHDTETIGTEMLKMWEYLVSENPLLLKDEIDFEWLENVLLLPSNSHNKKIAAIKSEVWKHTTEHQSILNDIIKDLKIDAHEEKNELHMVRQLLHKNKEPFVNLGDYDKPIPTLIEHVGFISHQDKIKRMREKSQ